jgi:transposase-like protein
MSTRRYHLHSTEFKIRLVQSYLAGEGTLKGLARQHGIYHSLLRLWVGKYQRGHFDERDSLLEKVDEYEAKIASLERKVGQLTKEVDLLKNFGRRHRREAPRRRSSPGPWHLRRRRMSSHEPPSEYVLQEGA